MEIVQPIRDKAKIAAMKRALSGRDKLLFIFGINSGLRVSDLLKLRVGDVRNRKCIVLREKKTGKTKKFALNRAIIEAVRELVPPDAPDDEYLFKSRKGGNRPITRQQAYNILNAAAKRAGIAEPIGTHTMRKTFGYHAYRAGTDLSLLQSIFNHSSSRVTLRYIGIEQDDIDDVYVRINL